MVGRGDNLYRPVSAWVLFSWRADDAGKKRKRSRRAGNDPGFGGGISIVEIHYTDGVIGDRSCDTGTSYTCGRQHPFAFGDSYSHIVILRQRWGPDRNAGKNGYRVSDWFPADFITSGNANVFGGDRALSHLDQHYPHNSAILVSAGRNGNVFRIVVGNRGNPDLGNNIRHSNFSTSPEKATNRVWCKMTLLSIYRPARLMKMLRADAQNISRDPIMLIIVLFSFVAPILIGIYRDDLNNAAATQLGISDMSRYASLIAVIMPAFLIGWVTGFLMLEDRDDGPLLAMETTPIGKNGFILYRASVSIVVCFVVSLLAAQIVLPEMTVGARIYVAAMVALEGTIVAFILLALAKNKVEGLALSKLINVGSLIPLFAIFTSEWRFLAGIFPTFWIGEYFGLANAASISSGVAASIGLIVHAIWLWGMMHLIARRIG